MPNIISFDARKFQADDSIPQNEATRLIVTQLGKTTELFELDGTACDTAQIVCKPELLPNEDYLFQFAVTHGFNDTNSEICRCIVVYDGKWDERYEYDLARSRFQPLVSKRIWDGGLLRVFQIPIKTAENTDVQILLLSRRCITRVYPPYALTDYASLPDMTYQQWTEQSKAPTPKPAAPAPQKPENPVDALMQKLDRLTAPVMPQNNQAAAPAQNQEQQDEALANYVQEYMTTHAVEMNVPDAMKTFNITERQATKCMRILFERNVLKYDLDTRKYKIIAKK